MKKSKSNIQTANKLLAEGIALQEQGKLGEAEKTFHALLVIAPKSHWALFSLSVIALNRNDALAALGFLNRATAVAPGVVAIWHARGVALAKLERRTDALESFDKALKLEPRHVDALNDSAALLLKEGRRSEALQRFNRILTIEPNAKALSNLSIIHAESINDADLAKSAAILEQLLALDPNYSFAQGRLVYQRLHLCDWRDYTASSQRVVQGVRAGMRSCNPIPFMVMSSEAADQQQCARTYAQFYFAQRPQALWRGEKYNHTKIRIAYVSPDFREHPVGQLMAGVLERHDKSRFETIAISMSHDDNSALRSRIVQTFDKFIDAHALGAAEIAAQMRAMEVDIAIDLAGFTAQSGSAVFAHRPAPIQINYLGYPGTLGTDFMDYILADAHVIPPGQQHLYNEKVAYLPDAYLPTDGAMQIAQRTPSRSECGLPDDGFIFCSFSHDHKIAPAIFDMWMRLLMQVPGSVLWLMSRLSLSTNNLRKEAIARGIDPRRLVFAGRLPEVQDHLARYRLADLFLDTFPYNAHTTAADALFVGLPVLTCMGNAFPSRVAGSLLHAIGLPELITHSLADYERKALELANAPLYLASLRTKLAANRNTCPLFNTELFCKNLESVLTQLHNSHHEIVKTKTSPNSNDQLLQAIALQSSGQHAAAESLLNACLEATPHNALALYHFDGQTGPPCT
jgi:protein O-GlcNAc transferase